ncbi:MAG: GPR endopeptidase [Oscillospiraceae bacterium]|nr:GPR endopeptidase [Oscillospiraceae bacterium]
MWTIRTDLAVEAREIWAESAEAQTELPGVIARDKNVAGFDITTVRITDEQGARELNKPVGTYITVELDRFINREEGAFNAGSIALAQEIEELIQMEPGDSALVVGLGNSAITADAIGPMTARHTMVTRHLVDKMPEEFGMLRRVSVLESGVLGTTGMESAELIKAVTERIRPDRVIVVDALASRRFKRVCRTVQLADTGIVPGSGVGNGRMAINTETLGIPVTAIGVPTVVDAGTLAADIAEKAGSREVSRQDFENYGGDMIVTPKDIDTSVNDISKFIGYALNLAFHQGITVDDITMFLG